MERRSYGRFFCFYIFLIIYLEDNGVLVKTSNIHITPEVTAMACLHNCRLRNECNEGDFNDDNNKRIDEENSITALLKKKSSLTAILIVGIKIDDTCLKKSLIFKYFIYF